MALECSIDLVVASRGWRRSGLAVPEGASLTFEGWAADGELRPSARVAVIVDGVRAGEGECGLPRPDVSLHRGAPALARSGFRIVLSSAGLALGRHRLQFAFSFGPNEAQELTEVYTLEVYSRAPLLPESTSRPRVIVVAAPKSGSSHVLHLLINYYRIEHLSLTDYNFEQEHVLTPELLTQLRGRPFVLQLHMLPRTLNIEFLNASGIAPVVTWRNLADVVISYDDHVRNEGLDTAAGTFTYIRDRARYLAMPDQMRYQFLIRHMLPWYVHFYLGWQDVKAPIFMHYEQIVENPFAYFHEVIMRLSGRVDEARLRGLVGRRFEGARFNVGRNGRALEQMTAETRSLLEESLAGHYEDLHELIDELPWRRPRWVVSRRSG